MGETAFIESLRALATDPAARALRDDAAVLEVGGATLVLTHDMIVEGVHYLPGDPPGDVAWKLLAVNLSDLAAKGARPIGVLLGYSLGDDSWDDAFVAGLGTALGAFEIPLLLHLGHKLRFLPLLNHGRHKLERDEPLLDALTKDFVAHNFDLKHLMRTIVQSRTYQLSGESNETNRNDLTNYSRALPRPLPAAVLLDAISSTTGVPEEFKFHHVAGGGDPPPGSRAMQMVPDVCPSQFMDAFDRSLRKTPQPQAPSTRVRWRRSFATAVRCHEILRGSDRDHGAVIDDADPITEPLCFFHGMRREQHGAAALAEREQELP